MKECIDMVKKCTCCGVEFPASFEYFYKQKKGKFGLKSICKVCSCAKIKEYRKLDYVKENHRISMAEWRKNNHEKFLEISRRCWLKNKNEINKKRVDRYRTDEDYRRKKIEKDRLYSASGRRYEMNAKPEQREKARIRSRKRRQNMEKRAHDLNRNAKWREENKDYVKQIDAINRKELAPSYVAQILKMSVKDVPPSVIETKRIIVKLRRELKRK